MDQLKSDIADSIKYSQYVDKEIKSASVSEKTSKRTMTNTPNK